MNPLLVLCVVHASGFSAVLLVGNSSSKRTAERKPWIGQEPALLPQSVAAVHREKDGQ